MGKPPEGSLKPAYQYGHIGIKAFKLFCVDRNRPVGSCPRFSAGGICVVASALFCGGVVGNHRIYISAVYQKGKPRFSEAFIIAVVLRLRNNADLIPRVLKNPRDYRRAEARMVYISVPRDYYKIGLIPAVPPHFFNCYR